MLYFELGLGEEDYLTEKEYQRFGRFRKVIWLFKSRFGIVVKKKIDSKFVYVIPKVNKKFLRKVKKIIRVTGAKQVCISNELFYKEEFMNLLKEEDIYICQGNWIKRYLLCNILEYMQNISKEDYSSMEIAFLVNTDYEIVLEYIKLLSNQFKLITIITNNIKYFSKLEKKYFEKEGIELNIVNNFKKSLAKTNIIVNIDFEEKQIQKYNIGNKVKFLNLYNKYEINVKNFEGINVTSLQIALPDKYLQYAELFKNFDYLYSYESLIKKKTSSKNILNEIEKDNLQIISLENEKGMIKKQDFLREIGKILDK